MRNKCFRYGKNINHLAKLPSLLEVTRPLDVKLLNLTVVSKKTLLYRKTEQEDHAFKTSWLHSKREGREEMFLYV
jgi:hypothetical protein